MRKSMKAGGAALLYAAVGLAGLLPAAAGADATGPIVGCSMYADGVLDVMGQSAAYMFIGARPVCADAGKKKRFCAALQTREGNDTVREHSEAAESAAADAKDLPEEARAAFLQQHPKRSFDQALVACGLKSEQAQAKLVAETQARIQSGKSDTLSEDLEFLRRESPATVDQIWKRECAGRVTGKLHGELGMGVEFKGNPGYAGFCQRTTKVDKDKAPGRFGG